MQQSNIKRKGVAAQDESAAPFAFQNLSLAPCGSCGDIHEYLTRNCAPLIVFGIKAAQMFHYGKGFPEKQLDQLPSRWTTFGDPVMYDREGNQVD